MIGYNRITHIATALAAVTLLAAAGCADERHIGWERQRQVIGPLPLKSGVAYVDSARDLVVVVDVSADRPRVHRYPIGRQAIYAIATPDREHLAVITRGEEAVTQGQIDEEPHLWLIDVSAPDTTPSSYPIGSPFDRLAIAGDGSVAVAYFSAAGADSGGFFRNPNELAIIDLHSPPGADNPTIKTVRSFGSVPEGVVLSPPMAIPGADDPTPRIFAFVLALNNLTVLDATYPERHEVTIRLDQAGAAVRPREMVFAPNTATAYLRSDNARDVLEIIIGADPPVGNDVLQNDYRPALAELGAGGGPADIAVYDDREGRRLILAATPSTREIAVIDADTAGFTTIDTPDPIDRILLFPAGGAVPPRVALLASINARLPRVHLLRLDGITDELKRVDLDTVTLDKPVLDVVPVPGRALGMIVHDDNRTVLGLLDVVFGSVSPLQGVGRLDSYDFSPEGRYLLGVTSGVARVGVLDLDNLHPADMRLDDRPTRVFALPNGRVYVEHGDSVGRATILPTAGASRAESVVLTGFLLADLFAQEF
jgi:hypothetical protein